MPSTCLLLPFCCAAGVGALQVLEDTREHPLPRGGIDWQDSDHPGLAPAPKEEVGSASRRWRAPREEVDSGWRAPPHLPPSPSSGHEPVVPEPEPFAPEPADARAVLLFGCSLDNYAVVDFCSQGRNLDTYKVDSFSHSNWCFDRSLNVKIGAMFHPGVGYKGDLEYPFWHYWGSPLSVISGAGNYSTKTLLDKYAINFSQSMFQREPDMVVVDSSLWDLAVWQQEDGDDERAERPQERVQQWCQHDLPGLMATVSRTFPDSRVAFRTAPECLTCSINKFTNRMIEQLHECITQSTRRGKLFGMYDIIDLRGLMQNLSAGAYREYAYREDGYHQSKYASLLYLNEVFRHLREKW